MQIYNRSWLLAGLFCFAPIALAASSDSAPIISIAADQSTTEVGNSVQISWSTAHADNCVAIGNWSGSRTLEGAARSPTMDAAGSYEFGLRCSNSTVEVSRTVSVNASDGSGPLYESAWIAEPTVVEHRPAFSQAHLKWRIQFRLASIGTQQALVSYDEKQQKTAGHTTVLVDKRGYIQVRHQDGASGSYTTSSTSRVQPGTDHEILLEIEKGERLSLSLDGKMEATSRQAFGTDETARSLVLGASCTHCRPGTMNGLRDPIDGVMAFAVVPTVSISVPEETPADVPTEPENPSEGALKPSSEEFTTTNAAKVIPFQDAFSQPNTKWQTTFKLDRVDRQQSLFSYDETYQDTSGHTTLSVTAAGYLSLRHQDGGSQSIVLTSKTRLRPGVAYAADVIILKNQLLALELNGVREASSTKAFGTDGTRRHLVLGASCSRCKRGTTAPLVEQLYGTVSLQVASALNGSDEEQGDGTEAPSQPPTSPNSPEAEPTEPAPDESPEPEPTTPPTGGDEPVHEPKPTLNLTANRSGIIAGESVTLNWNSTNATQCSASGAWSGSQVLAGQLSVNPQHSARTYSLECAGPGGTASSIVTIGVQTEVTVSWVPPTTNTDGSDIDQLRGYVVHFGPSQGNYTSEVEVNNPGARSKDLYLPSGDYYFAVTAVNTNGVSSDYSTEVSKSIQ